MAGYQDSRISGFERKAISKLVPAKAGTALEAATRRGVCFSIVHFTNVGRPEKTMSYPCFSSDLQISTFDFDFGYDHP